MAAPWSFGGSRLRDGGVAASTDQRERRKAVLLWEGADGLIDRFDGCGDTAELDDLGNALRGLRRSCWHVRFVSKSGFSKDRQHCMQKYQGTVVMTTHPLAPAPAGSLQPQSQVAVLRVVYQDTACPPASRAIRVLYVLPTDYIADHFQQGGAVVVWAAAAPTAPTAAAIAAPTATGAAPPRQEHRPYSTKARFSDFLDHLRVAPFVGRTVSLPQELGILFPTLHLVATPLPRRAPEPLPAGLRFRLHAAEPPPEAARAAAGHSDGDNDDDDNNNNNNNGNGTNGGGGSHHDPFGRLPPISPDTPSSEDPLQPPVRPLPGPGSGDVADGAQTVAAAAGGGEDEGEDEDSAAAARRRHRQRERRRWARLETQIRRQPPHTTQGFAARWEAATPGEYREVFGRRMLLGGGMVGLGNPTGVQCYINSVVQCLSHTPLFHTLFVNRNYLVGMNRDNVLGTAGQVAEQLGALLKELWRCRFAPAASKALWDTVGRHRDQFSEVQQQDAQEFLQALLDFLHEDYNEVKTRVAVPKFEPPDSMTIDDAAQEAWARHLVRNRSFLVHHCQALLTSTLQCRSCGKGNLTFDPYMQLTVELPNSELPVLFSFLLFPEGYPTRAKPILIRRMVPPATPLKQVVKDVYRGMREREERRAKRRHAAAVAAAAASGEVVSAEEELAAKAKLRSRLKQLDESEYYYDFCFVGYSNAVLVRDYTCAVIDESTMDELTEATPVQAVHQSLLYTSEKFRHKWLAVYASPRYYYRVSLQREPPHPSGESVVIPVVLNTILNPTKCGTLHPLVMSVPERYMNAVDLPAIILERLGIPNTGDTAFVAPFAEPARPVHGRSTASLRRLVAREEAHNAAVRRTSIFLRFGGYDESEASRCFYAHERCEGCLVYPLAVPRILADKIREAVSDGRDELLRWQQQQQEQQQQQHRHDRDLHGSPTPLAPAGGGNGDLAAAWRARVQEAIVSAQWAQQSGVPPSAVAHTRIADLLGFDAAAPDEPSDELLLESLPPEMNACPDYLPTDTEWWDLTPADLAAHVARQHVAVLAEVSTSLASTPTPPASAGESPDAGMHVDPPTPPPVSDVEMVCAAPARETEGGDDGDDDDGDGGIDEAEEEDEEEETCPYNLKNDRLHNLRQMWRSQAARRRGLLEEAGDDGGPVYRTTPIVVKAVWATGGSAQQGGTLRPCQRLLELRMPRPPEDTSASGLAAVNALGQDGMLEVCASNAYHVQQLLKQEDTVYTVGDCMKQFTAVEKLDEGDSWYCPRCKSNQPSKKKLQIWSLPNMLFIHIKRFSCTDGLSTRLRHAVEFPLDSLDLSPYLAKRGVSTVQCADIASPVLKAASPLSTPGGGDLTPLTPAVHQQPPQPPALALPPSHAFPPCPDASADAALPSGPAPQTQPPLQTPPTPGDATYKLLSIVCHHGPDIQFGHYTSVCRNQVTGYAEERAQ